MTTGMTQAKWSAYLCLFVAACDDSGTSDNVGGSDSGGSAAGGEGSGAAAGGAGGSAESAADRLYLMLTGHFDSSVQAERNAAYFPIDLLTCPIDIPELGARTLHVEQSFIEAGEVQTPYRQRVYVVTEGADPATQAISQVWEFDSPASFAGFCDRNGDQATATDVFEREGCQVEVTWVDDHFEGSTPGKLCLSDLNGATYATSDVSIYEGRIESWDRGYDAADVQVWGATAGPYLFSRLVR